MHRRIAIAVLLGILNAVVVYFNGYHLLNITMDADGVQLVMYKSLQIFGMFTLGAGSSYLFLKYRLLLPVVLTGAFTAYSLYDHLSSSMEGFTSLYLGVWFVFLVFVAIVAIVEYGVRKGLSIYPPTPV